MKTNHWVLLAVLLLAAVGCQDDEMMSEPEIETPCELGRYTTADFTSQNVTTVKYGEGMTPIGNQDLYMDIYTPEGDSLQDRPMIVLAFGGAFITGDRSQMEPFARLFASYGYVVASIDYRLASGFPTTEQIQETAIRAMHDVKAAVRYLRNDALTENLYGIDPDNIIVGGVSSGGVAALSAAFFDQEDLAMVNAGVAAAVERNGGIEGTSNDLQVSSEVSGVINFSGGINDLEWIDQGEPWVLSVHGDMDEVVPYGTGQVDIGLPIDLTLSGGGAMVDRLEAVGIDNALWTVSGGGHVDIYADQEYEGEREDFFLFATDFLVGQVCE